LSERAACDAVGMSRSVYHYQPDGKKDDAVIIAIQLMVERYPAYGFSKVFTVLRREGFVNLPRLVPRSFRVILS
jgi:putative transposase